ncbi:MAG: carB, partial [Deltaproteobacteria bacterium]|nr:carB [Deltaproteobacteria bacterium]
TLDEIRNDITRETPASFEPTIDYVVVKIPRFTFEKFPAADATLMTQMKSVGEVMSIGRTFKESLQKAIRSLEIGTYGFESKWSVPSGQWSDKEKEVITEKLRIPNWERLWYVGDAFRAGFSIDEIFEITKFDRWFLSQIHEIIEFEDEIQQSTVGSQQLDLLRKAKELGFSDKRLAVLLNKDEAGIRKLRKESGIEPVFKRVDTCAAEFEAHTPYLYSTYERPFYQIADNAPAFSTPSLPKRGLGGVSECEANPTNRKKIMILGGGPNRIGQGIEFDYCCVHASFALKEDGFETIMVNCNPETVSTDYDTSDRLYFEPLTFEDVMNIVEKERPDGVIVQFGGQTPLKLAVSLEKAGVKIIGTSPESIDRAEDRERFAELLNKLGLKQAENGIVRSPEEAQLVAERIGYPVMVRPSYVLGGRAMEIVYDSEALMSYMQKAINVSGEHPILIDRFLNDAIEVDVDCISDGETIVVGGIMEHIEEAGIHSGDSACSLPPYSLDKTLIEEIAGQTKALARELKVIGLMNIQFAIKDRTVYVLEVNPRGSRTVPFVSKAIGVPLAKLAARIMAAEIEKDEGKKQTLKKLGFTKEIVPIHFSVKEAVFPFIKFPGVDTILGPEMKSTGEVMGIDSDFGKAFGKAQMAAGVKLPLEGKVFISIKDSDKRYIIELSKKLLEMGFIIVATKGTSNFLNDYGIPNQPVLKVAEGRPHVVDSMKSGDIQMVINTSFGAKAVKDSYDIRRTALTQNIAYYTTIAGAKAAVSAIDALKRETLDVKPIQEYHKP